MWFARTSEGFRAWFALKSAGGSIRTGALAGHFTVTIVNPTDAANTTAVVSESAQKPGLYTFLVPSAFLTTHSAGDYGVVVQVAVPAPKSVTDVLSDVLTVSVEDLDSVAAGVSGVTASVLAGSVPELPQGQPPTAPTVAQALALLYMTLRNSSESTATERRVKNDAGTVVAKAPLSDNGTTFTQGKLVSGP